MPGARVIFAAESSSEQPLPRDEKRKKVGKRKNNRLQFFPRSDRESNANEPPDTVRKLIMPSYSRAAGNASVIFS